MEKMSKTVDEIVNMQEQKRAQKMLRVKELLMKISEEDFDDLMKEIGSLIR
mgnify:FL=1|jgi:hypothetical protein